MNILHLSKTTAGELFKTTRLASTAALAISLYASHVIAADAPGIIANEPLQTSATAEPNIVFLLDNSQSMINPGNNINGITRLQTLKNVLHDIIPELNAVRVGMFTFDSGNGARMLDAGGSKEMRILTKSDPNYNTNLGYFTTSGTGTIDALSAGSGGTILAESLQDIGRYYANGDHNNPGSTSGACGGDTAQNLVIHPDQTTPGDTPAGLKATHSCESLLGNKEAIRKLAEPMIYSCQKNFAIVMSDGETKKDIGIRSDASTFTNTVDDSGAAFTDGSLPEHPFRDYDEDCTSDKEYPNSDYKCTDNYDNKFTSNDGGTTFTQPKYPINGDGGTDFLDDVAMALYEMDLRPDYSQFTNNVITYTIGFGASTFDSTSPDYNPLMLDAATHGGGEFYFANNASSLTESFQSALNSIVSQTSTSSSVTFNSSTLSSQSAVYQALFNTSSWSGELNSFPLDGITGQVITNCTSGTDNCWNATTQLDGQTYTNRFMITYGDNNHGVEVKYDDSTDDYTSLSSSSDIPQAMVNDLCAVAAGDSSGTSFPCQTSDSGTTKTNNSAYLEDLVEYIRGDRSKEGPAASERQFRKRVSRLGDIVNSSPVYVGAPQQNWPDSGNFPSLTSTTTDYRNWKNSSVKDRPEVVYVSSNDGMLHGFRATNSTDATEDVNTSAGQEVFAYIPTGLFSTSNTKGLHFLADSDYTHRFYNDLTPTISDVYMESKNSSGEATGTFSPATLAKNSSTASWRTVLLGGLGGGGKSFYLLDVTDPVEYTDNAKQNEKKLVMWEFSDSDDSSLGYTYSKPTIAMMNNGRFAAIFGNGYNSANCKAELFVVFLEGGLDGDWTDTGDYIKFDTGTAHGGGPADCNGLSTPAVVDLNRDGTADRVYAGDLKGNMWVFDLCDITAGGGTNCSTNYTDWSLAHTDPLMTAEDASNNPQPITSKPIVARDPASTQYDDLMIVFGTGQYLADADKSSTNLQRVYGVRDADALTNGSAGQNGKWNHDGDANNGWAEQTLSIDGTYGTRAITSPDSIANNDNGWRIDLNLSGERVVVNPKVRNNILFFNTLIPNDTKCSYGGSGWIMSVSLKNGGVPVESVFDVDNDGTIGDADDISINAVGQLLNEIPAESTFLGDNQYTPGSDGNINVREVNVGDSIQEGRLSWQELFESF